MPFLQIDDETNIFYYIKEPFDLENCETIIFISGWTSDHNFWIPYLPYFKRYRCITFDNRGVGETAISPKKPITINLMVDDILNLINHLKLKRVILYGISMGGMVALNFAIQHPDYCSKIVIASSCGRLTPKMKYMFDKFVLLEELNQELFAEILLGLCYSKKVWNNENLYDLFKRTLEYKKKHPQKSGNCRKQKEAIYQHDVLEYLENIKMPTLVIGSLEDELIPMELVRELKMKIPHAEILELSDEGHVPVNYEFLKEVLSFLEK